MANKEEVTVVLQMTIKAGREDEFRQLAKRLVETSNAEDEGCLNYVIMEQLGNPREWVLFERWRDLAAVTAHIVRLQTMIGPPPPGKQGLPAKLLDFLETSRSQRYRVLD